MKAPRVLLVASRSAHKLAELRRMLSGLLERGEIELLDVEEAEARLGRALPEVEEDAPDFAGNAEKKARALAQATGFLTLADDSGLCVDALGGDPGVRSARFSGAQGSLRDQANNEKLIRELEGVPPKSRSAAFVCALCLVPPEGEARHVEGRCRGQIAFEPRGEGGFGYDPLFLPEGIEGQRTYAELSAEEKDAISHRGRALSAMRRVLEEAVGGMRNRGD